MVLNSTGIPEEIKTVEIRQIPHSLSQFDGWILKNFETIVTFDILFHLFLEMFTLSKHSGRGHGNFLSSTGGTYPHHFHVPAVLGTGYFKIIKLAKRIMVTLKHLAIFYMKLITVSWKM